jgi:hypothetical protein
MRLVLYAMMKAARARAIQAEDMQKYRPGPGPGRQWAGTGPAPAGGDVIQPGTRAADLLAGRFPDGRFFLDLRGMDPRPLEPGTALARLLRALGMADRQIPQDVQEQSAAYRARLSDPRCLIVAIRYPWRGRTS